MTLHYLINGSLRLRLAVGKQEFMIPLSLVLKALQPLASDRTLSADLTARTDRCHNDILGVDFEGALLQTPGSDLKGMYLCRRFTR